MKGDLKIKRAEYISKNNDILQEFGFSHPKTKMLINSIYNSHFYGSSLWDLFTKEAVQLESSWNVSIKLMMDLPRETHRNLIEPLSGILHLKTILIKRFLAFIMQIKKSNKKAAKFLLESIQFDTNSVTGSNLRNILLLTDKADIQDLLPADLSNLKYHPIQNEDKWKVSILQEILEIKHGNLGVDDFNYDELDEIVEFLCVS